MTDRYPAYFGKRLSKFLQGQQVKHRVTTPYHPQANGLCERTNRTFINRLKCAKDEYPNKSWVKLLADVTEQYNNSPHSTTQYPPSYLLNGRMTSRYLNINHNYPPVSVALEEAVERFRANREQQARKHHQVVKQPNWKVGDMVYIQSAWTNSHHKLAPKFIGPYKVMGQVSKTVYEVDKFDYQTNQPTTHIHANLLKKCKGNEQQPKVKARETRVRAIESSMAAQTETGAQKR